MTQLLKSDSKKNTLYKLKKTDFQTLEIFFNN